MKNKKLIITLIVSLVLIITITSGVIAAWLTDSKDTAPTTFTIGDVEYTWSGSMVTSPVVPGQNLVNQTFTLANTSTVQTELRVKIISNSTKLGGDASSLINLVMGNGWQNGGDGYWYYQGADTVVVDEDGVTKYKIPTSVDNITVLSGLSLDGTKVGNLYSDTDIVITFSFEAKQSDYVTWEQLGTASIDFTTGLAS